MIKKKFMAIALTITLAFLITSCGKSTPSKTVEQFYDRLDEGNVDKAIKLLSPQAMSDFGEGITRRFMSQEVAAINRQKGIKTLTVEQENIIGDRAEVTLTIQYKNGDKTTKVIPLINNQEEWQISSYKQ